MDREWIRFHILEIKVGVKLLIRKVVNYFHIHEGESMGRHFIVFNWKESRTLIKIKIKIPIFLWHLCGWDFETGGLLNGIYIFYVGWSFRIRDKKSFSKRVNLITQHFLHGWIPWRKKCRFLSEEELENSGLTKLGRHLAKVTPREIWNEYYTRSHEVIVEKIYDRIFLHYDERKTLGTY